MRPLPLHFGTFSLPRRPAGPGPGPPAPRDPPFRALLLPPPIAFVRFFRLSRRSSSSRLAPAFIVRCGICDSVREPTAQRTFLSRPALSPSLCLSSSSFMSLSLSPSSSSSSVPLVLYALLPDPRPPPLLFLRSAIDFVSSGFCRATGMKAGGYIRTDVVSDRQAFLLNLTSPRSPSHGGPSLPWGQLEHSTGGVIVFASRPSRVSVEKINRLRPSVVRGSRRSGSPR